jgi:hypothetical protein
MSSEPKSTELVQIATVPPPTYTLNDLVIMAEMVAKSGLFKDVRTTEAAFTLMLLCQAEGLHPIQAMRIYDIIDGKPAMKSAAMQARFQARGGTVQWVQTDGEVCEVIFHHPRFCPNGKVVTVTLRELCDNGVALTGSYDGRPAKLKTNYQRHPDSMLRARCISKGVRMIDPEVVTGLHTPEELIDMRDESPAAALPIPRFGQPSARPPALAPAPRKNPWQEYATGVVNNANDALNDECAVHNVKDRKGWAKLVGHPAQLTQVVVSEALIQEPPLILRADVDQDKKPGTRDPVKCARVAAGLYDSHREWVEETVEAYIHVKCRESHADLGIPDGDNGNASQEVPDAPGSRVDGMRY